MNAAPTPDWQPDPQLLAAYFDGELEGRDEMADLRARIESWIETHPEAADEHQSLTKLWQETTPSDPATNWNETLDRIDRERARPRGKPASRRTWLVAGVIAASVALFFGILFSAVRWSLPDTPDNPPQAHKDETEDSDVFAVAVASEIRILRVGGQDFAALVVGEPPVTGPLELADPGEIRVVRVRRNQNENTTPHVRRDGRPMVFARVETE